MKEKKMLARIARIQLIDAGTRDLKQGRVAGGKRLPRIGEVGKQAELNVLLLIRQEANLEFIEFLPNGFSGRKHHRDYNQRGVFGGNARVEVQFGERFRGEQS